MEKKEANTSRRGGKTAAMKADIEELLRKEPNARILLLGRNGKQVVTSENNTELNEYKEPKLLTTPNHERKEE